MMGWETLVELSDAIRKETGGEERVETVTPMRFANVVTLDEQGQRKVVRMRWGLVPPWADDALSLFYGRLTCRVWILSG